MREFLVQLRDGLVISIVTPRVSKARRRCKRYGYARFARSSKFASGDWTITDEGRDYLAQVEKEGS
jgi:hypothetical protein